MKNTIIKIFLLFALCGSILSCKKGEKGSYPKTLYQTSKFIKKYDIRLYTKNGEITEANTIEKFTYDPWGDVVFTLENIPISENNTITFLSKNSMQFRNRNLTYDLVSDVSNPNSEFVFFSQSENNIDPEHLYYKILKFKSPLIAIGSDRIVGYNAKEILVANGSYSELNLSVLCLQIGHHYKRIHFNQPVVFDATFLEQLQTTDTIAVKEYIVNYKAK